MDLNSVDEVRPATATDWRPGDAWLGGGTFLFSEPQPHVSRLLDLKDLGWPPLVRRSDHLEIAGTCTVAQLRALEPDPDWASFALVDQCSRAFLASFKIWNEATVGGNLCNGLPAGPMISLTAALDGECVLRAAPDRGPGRTVPVAEFVTGNGLKQLEPGEVLRAVRVPYRALRRRSAFRQVSLTPHGRSAALLVGTSDPVDGAFTLTVTASTPRPVQLRLPSVPSAEALRTALSDRLAPEDYFDDMHGHPRWRRHVTHLLAEQIRAELSGGTT
ncbi:FAD binding domain-containing protein [Nocardiopsis sp. HNM0947]|uniref:FAD binding domain-containing protein n=1 Tax=Nocardiopsis coralli TaxID=2772213 RepID=A0ABR9PCZ6_9ACTN|nr:FAD binding domain-containing protein [Nocardiopsis coralli]MBE3001694.1 FAD binding domain-containing protein [Nocardiopsis coralli]